jgi:hypothetical protein
MGHVCIKKTFYLQFYKGTSQGHQKSIFNTSKVKKKRKMYTGSIRRSLQVQPKILKKLSDHQINQSVVVFSIFRFQIYLEK